MPAESLLSYCFPNTKYNENPHKAGFRNCRQTHGSYEIFSSSALPVCLHLNGTFCHTCYDILLQENIKNDNRDDRYQHSREDQLPRVTVLT